MLKDLPGSLDACLASEAAGYQSFCFRWISGGAFNTWNRVRGHILLPLLPLHPESKAIVVLGSNFRILHPLASR